MNLKRYIPKSLLNRVILIIILPVIIMQIAVTYFFFNAHWARVTANLSDSVAANIAVTLHLYAQEPTQQNTQNLDALLRPDMQLSVVLREGDDLPSTNRNAFFSALDKTLRRALTQTLDQPFWFDTTRYPNHIDIRVKVDAGVLRFIAVRERVFAPTGFVFIFWLLTATILSTLISIFFVRRQASPIMQLAAAADAFGKGQDISGFKPSGASEVRLAGHSFLKMRSRIKRHLEQRTMMLAGVSHDLRTPLTRLKLQLAMLDQSDDLRAAQRDITEMEAMLSGYLDFARGTGDEKPQMTDLAALVRSVIAQFDNVMLDLQLEPQLELRPAMIKRAISNLVSNALKYGKTVEVQVQANAYNIFIHVDDDGPGIPKDKRGQVFKAFQRLDAARNQNIEGVGLGLSIARDIAQLHGGKIDLGKSDKGGLRASLLLPI